MRILKITGIALVCIVVVIVAGLAITKVWIDASYFKGYDPSAPLDPVVTGVTEKPTYTCEKLYFNGFRGDRVPTLLLTPKNAPRPVPCVIFLHGIGQEKEFILEEFEGKTVAEPFLDAGFAFVTFDQFMRGERKEKHDSFLGETKAFRMRPVHTVNDTRRLIDYLETRGDIAKNRIYLDGASYGAITGSTAAALDTRIRAVVLTYGGGNVPAMLSSRMIAGELRKSNIPLSLVKFAGWYFLGVSDPVRYIGRISPRPVFLQNGTNDSLIATEAAKALQNAALEPKIIKWYEGDHIGTDVKTVFTVLNDSIDFLKAQDTKIVAAEPAEKAAA